MPVDQAAVWTYNFFQQFDVSVCAQASNNPAVYIAETGWPTASDNGPGPAVGAAIPSIANLQTFLDTYVCQANANGTKTFFFEAFDEPWKAIYGGVEQHWGLNTADRTLKPGLTIPNCEASRQSFDFFAAGGSLLGFLAGRLSDRSDGRCGDDVGECSGEYVEPGSGYRRERVVRIRVRFVCRFDDDDELEPVVFGGITERHRHGRGGVERVARRRRRAHLSPGLAQRLS